MTLDSKAHGYFIYYFLTADIPTIAFGVHLYKDSLQTRKWLYNICALFYFIGFLWITIVPWLWGPGFFGDCFSYWHAYESEIPLMGVIFALATLILVI